MMAEGKMTVAVVGLGRAGRARVEALREHPRARLVAVARQRPGPQERRFEEVLGDAGIEAVILCTPNLEHPRMARAALAAGKHVAVEFPLAASAAEGRELLELAVRAKRVLHVEHIELLSPAQLHQRARVAVLGAPRGGTLRFTGASGGWIASEELAGSTALRAEARLHRLVDLFGEARVLQAALERRSGGYRLEVELGFGADPESRVRLIEERAAELSRGTRWDIRCQHGLLDDPPAQRPGALFREDLDCFLARIRDAAPPYVTDARVLHILGLVGEIEALCERGMES